MRRERKLWRLTALLLALAMLLSSTGAALSEAMAVEEAQPAEIVEVEEAQPARDEVVEEVADAPEVEAVEAEAQPSEAPEAGELPAGNESAAPSEESAQEPSADEAEPPLAAEGGEEAEPDAPVAKLAVIVEPGEGAELRALLQAEGLLFAPVYRWQSVERAAYTGAISSGADADALWADIEGAEGEALDAAAAMGEAYADFCYRCVVQSGDMISISAAYNFPVAETVAEEVVAEEAVAEEAAPEETPEVFVDESEDNVDLAVLAPGCKHDFKDYSSEDDIFEEPMIDEVIEVTNDTHTVTAWVVTGKKCSKCGFFSEYNIALKTYGPEAHKYNSSGACSICSKVCNHEKATKREWVRAYSGYFDLEPISDTQHASFMDVQEAVQCPTCHKTLDNNGPALTHMTMVDPEPHDFDEDGWCSTCGYQRADHEHVFNFDGPDVEIDVYYDSYVPSADGSKCIGKGKTTIKAAKCENEYCDEYIYKQEYDANAQDEMDHVKSDDDINSWGDLNGLCAHCRAVKVCNHEHTVEVSADPYSSVYSELRSEDILLYGGEVTPNGNGTHTGKLVRTLTVSCLDCGAQRVRKEVVETTEHCHSLSGDVCDVCGGKAPVFVGMCKHPEEMREYFRDEGGWGYVECEGGHYMTEANYKFYCRACGLIDNADERRSIEEKVVEPHVFRDNGDGKSERCSDCYATPKCDNHVYVPSELTSAYGVDEGYIRNNMKTHLHVYGPSEYAHQTYKCENCGWIKIDESKRLNQLVEGYSVEEPHTWLSDGICAYCNEFFVCDHSAVTEDTPVISSRKVYIDDPGAADGKHIVRVYNTYKCPECKREVELPDEKQDTREPHEFVDGICSKCNHSNYYTNLQFPEEKIQLGVGEKTYAGIIATPVNATGEITYKSKSAKIATVDDQGIITGKAAGTTTITATCNELTATLTVTVSKKPKRVSLSASALEMGVDETVTLTAKLTGGSTGEISWTSDNQGVATVENGEVKALAMGTATITATPETGSPARCKVTVLPAPSADNMSMTLTNDLLGLGEKSQAAVIYTGAAGAYELASSEESVATINEKGEIKTVGAGKTTISVTAYNGFKIEKELEVRPKPTKVVFVNDPVKLGVNEEWPLSVKLYAVVNGEEVESAGAVTFSTSKSGVLSVDKASGKLIPKLTGSAKITAKAYSGAQASITISVMKAPTEFSLQEKDVVMGVGETGNPFTPVFGSSKEFGHVEWQIDDWGMEDQPPVVTLSGDMFTAQNVGKVDVSAKVYWEYVDGKGLYDFGTITVKAAPTPDDMKLELPRAAMSVGDKLQASFSYTGDVAGPYSFESDDKTIATVDQNGLVKGVKGGTTVIRVKAYNGATVEQPIEVVPKPTKIELTNKATKLGVGEIWQLGAKVSAGKVDITDKASYTFKSSKASVVEVVDAEAGKLVAKAKGSAKITVSTSNGKTASVTISVVVAPTGINLDRTEVAMGVGEPNIQLKASFPNKGAYGHVTWTSDEEGIVTVDDSGNLTALAEGEATVTASVHNSADPEHPLTAPCAVSVKAAPATEAMQVTLPKTTLGVGETMTAAFEYKDGTAGAYEFVIDKVGKTAYATVNKTTGVVKGAKVGEAQVYVKAYNGAVSEPQAITIVAAPTKVELLNKVTKMGEGETWQLGAKVSAGKVDVTEQVHYEYVSSKPSVVEVDKETGTLTAGALPAGKKSASAKITAKAYNGKSASVTITVYPAPESASLNKDELLLAEGQSEKLSVSYEQKNSFGNVIWTSDDEQVATVADGKVTAVRAGVARISAKIYNQEPLVCEVTVKAAPNAENAKLVPAKAKIGVGESVQLNLEYDGPANVVTSYKSSKTAYATVSKTGVVKGVKAGKVTITAVTYNDKSLAAEEKVSVEIEVVKAPTKLTITNIPEGNALKVGDTWTPEFEIEGYGGDDLTGLVTSFASNKPKIAKFENGVLTALAKGTAKITCKTYNGKTASFTLTVNAAE